jgi:hypothetical protein
MSSRIAFDLEHLAHFLGDRSFEVPPYQRSYAWKDDQVSAFWRDLLEALDSEADEYFMGTIVSSRKDGVSTVIDGQQRLATTSLLLAGLRDAYAARGDSARARGVQEKYLASFDLASATHVPRMRLNDEDRDFFQDVVINGVARAPEIGSHRRLAHAQEYLRRRMNEDLASHDGDWLQRANDWVKLLTDRVAVIVIDVPQVADGFVIFETLNDRGAPLTISDLLRNFLMSQAGAKLAAVEDAWGVVLLNLGLSEEESTFVDFFRQYWSSLHGATREKDLFREIRREITDSPSAVRFSESLPGSSRAYAALLDAQHEMWSELPEETGASVAALLRLELGQYRPLALAVLDEFTRDEQARTFRALVAWAVRGLIAGGIGGGVTERAYGRAASDVRNSELKTTADLYRQLLPIVPNDRDFRSAFSIMSVPRTSVARYLLTSIERAEQGIVRPEIATDDFGAGLRLQTVLPKSATPESWPDVPADDLRSAAALLGNYVLLAEGDPSLPRAGDFSTRKAVLAGSAIATTRKVAEAKTWSLEAVHERQTGFAERAVEIWPREPR